MGFVSPSGHNNDCRIYHGWSVHSFYNPFVSETPLTVTCVGCHYLIHTTLAKARAEQIQVAPDLRRAKAIGAMS